MPGRGGLPSLDVAAAVELRRRAALELEAIDTEDPGRAIRRLAPDFPVDALAPGDVDRLLGEIIDGLQSMRATTSPAEAIAQRDRWVRLWVEWTATAEAARRRGSDRPELAIVEGPGLAGPSGGADAASWPVRAGRPEVAAAGDELRARAPAATAAVWKVLTTGPVSAPGPVGQPTGMRGAASHALLDGRRLPLQQMDVPVSFPFNPRSRARRRPQGGELHLAYARDDRVRVIWVTALELVDR